MPLLIAVAVSACGGRETQDSTVPTTGAPTQTASSESEPTTTTGVSDPSLSDEVPDHILDSVIADAAQRSGLSAQDLSVVRAEAVEWSDGSLGCPEPGRFYTQAIVPGYWVEIEAGSELYDYRIDGAGDFRLCR